MANGIMKCANTLRTRYSRNAFCLENLALPNDIFWHHYYKRIRAGHISSPPSNNSSSKAKTVQACLQARSSMSACMLKHVGVLLFWIDCFMSKSIVAAIDLSCYMNLITLVRYVTSGAECKTSMSR